MGLSMFIEFRLRVRFYFISSATYFLFVLLRWFARWEVSGRTAAILYDTVSRICLKLYTASLCSSSLIRQWSLSWPLLLIYRGGHGPVQQGQTWGRKAPGFEWARCIIVTKACARPPPIPTLIDLRVIDQSCLAGGSDKYWHPCVVPIHLYIYIYIYKRRKKTTKKLVAVSQEGLQKWKEHFKNLLRNLPIPTKDMPI